MGVAWRHRLGLLLQIAQRCNQLIDGKRPDHAFGLFSAFHISSLGRGRQHGRYAHELSDYAAHNLSVQSPITVHLLWVPVGVFMAGFMALGFGMMMAPLNCVQRDVQHLIRFITRAGFFVSPVMWTAEMAMERGAWGEAALWNPMVLPITMVRHGLEGKLVDLPSPIIFSSIVVAIIVYLVGTIVFSKYERGAVKYL